MKASWKLPKGSRKKELVDKAREVGDKLLETPKRE